MNGIIVIRKEKGYTSHDVVAKLRGILHMKKIGHTGTLDPQAEGVLPVALGKATRLVELLTEKQKTYEAVLRLGVTTDTQDLTGTVQKECLVECSPRQVEEVIRSFLGEQMQVPPMYSALKVNGKKLYELAREGTVVERAPRPVRFYDLTVLEMDLPRVRFSVTCSKGTYIRTLCHDIGERLGCGGCMEELLRTASGAFRLEDSMTLSQVEEAVRQGCIEDRIISIEEVLKDYPGVWCNRDGDRLLENGNPIPEELLESRVSIPEELLESRNPIPEELPENRVSIPEEPAGTGSLPREGPVRMYRSSGEFAALYQWREEKERYYPLRMF